MEEVTTINESLAAYVMLLEEQLTESIILCEQILRLLDVARSDGVSGMIHSYENSTIGLLKKKRRDAPSAYTGL